MASPKQAQYVHKCVWIRSSILNHGFPLSFLSFQTSSFIIIASRILRITVMVDARTTFQLETCVWLLGPMPFATFTSIIVSRDTVWSLHVPIDEDSWLEVV